MQQVEHPLRLVLLVHVAQALGRPGPESVAPTRARLIEKGLIYSPAYGLNAFTVPHFDTYIRRTIPTSRPPPTPIRTRACPFTSTSSTAKPEHYFGVYAFDLTEAQLEQRILRPYRQGKAIVTGGRTWTRSD